MLKNCFITIFIFIQLWLSFSSFTADLELLDSHHLNLVFSEALAPKVNLSRLIDIRINEYRNNSIFYYKLDENIKNLRPRQSFIITLQPLQSLQPSLLTLTFISSSNSKLISISNHTLSKSFQTLTFPLPLFLLSSSSFLLSILPVILLLLLLLSLFLILLFPSSLFWNLFENCQILYILSFLPYKITYPTLIFLSFFRPFALLFPLYRSQSDEEKWIERRDEKGRRENDERFNPFFLEQTWLIIALVFTCLVAYIFTYLHKRMKWGWVWVDRLRSWIEWSVIIRVGMTCYGGIILCSFQEFQNNDGTDAMSVANLVGGMAGIMGVVIFMFFCWKNLNDKLFNWDDLVGAKKKLGALVDLLQVKAILKRNFNLIYMVRKIMVIGVVIFLKQSPLEQMSMLFLIQICLITLHSLKRPFLNRKIDYLQLFSEILLLAILLLMALIQSYDYLQSLGLSIENRFALGWTIVGLGLTIVFVKFVFVIGEIVLNGMAMWREWRRREGLKMKEEEEESTSNFIEMGKYTAK